jgi:CRISPR/Cas system CMR-associated protein Cmr1 (group 7 of RAMP superfamily)
MCERVETSAVRSQPIRRHQRRTPRPGEEIVQSQTKVWGNCMTMQGPRSSLKKFDYVNRPRITFQLRVLNDGVITEEILRTILAYCQETGLGADRSQGAGTFDVVAFERTSDTRRATRDK